MLKMTVGEEDVITDAQAAQILGLPVTAMDALRNLDAGPEPFYPGGGEVTYSLYEIMRCANALKVIDSLRAHQEL